MRDANGNISKQFFDLDGDELTGKPKNVNNKDVQGIDRIEEYTLTPKGSRTQLLQDNNADDTPDVRYVYDLDENERMIGTYIDSDNKVSTGYPAIMKDGSEVLGVNEITETIRNSLGSVVQRNYDYDGNGQVDRTVNYQLDNLGRFQTGYFDMDNSDITGADYTVNDEKVSGIDQIHHYKLNIWGRESVISKDLDANGQIDQVDYIVRDLTQNEIARYYDIDNDVTTGNSFEINGETVHGIDKIRYYERAPNTQIIQTYHDTNADKTIDTRTYHVRDNDGYELISYLDSDGNAGTGNSFSNINGVTIKGIDEIRYATNDPAGDIIKRETDTGANGSIDKVEYFPRENGIQLATYTDSDNDIKTGYTHKIAGEDVKGIDSIIYREDFSPASIPQKYRYDTDADGTDDEIRYSILNISESPITTYFDRDGKAETGKLFNVDGRTFKGIELIRHYLRSVDDTNFAVEHDTDANGKINSVGFQNIDSTLDMTAWNSEKLATFGNELATITLSNASAATSLTLDKATIAAISKTGFQIRGDSTDTVNLTDISNVEQLEKTVTSGGQVYNQYQFEHGKETYTLQVDTDIQVVLG